jgi:chromosome segregation ATPase
MITRTTVVAAAVSLVAPFAAPHLAHAQPKEQYTYRCTGKDGKKYYGQTIPPACLGQPMELINKQGLVVKRIDPEGDEKARIAKEAEAERKRELEAAQKDAQRRNRALLATYTSEKDIEESRKRALSEHQKQVQEVEKKIEDIRKRQARFEKDLEVYKEAGKGEPPSRLREEITNAQIDLKAQQGLLDAKRKEAAGINARYDEDRRRYREATGAVPRASTK